MIRTAITPQDTTLQFLLEIPDSYIGKQIEVLIFAADELNATPAQLQIFTSFIDNAVVYNLEEGDYS